MNKILAILNSFLNVRKPHELIFKVGIFRKKIIKKINLNLLHSSLHEIPPILGAKNYQNNND